MRSWNRRAFLIATLGMMLGVSSAIAEPLGKIAYIHSAQLWTQELPSGKPTRLITEKNVTGPRWSASGNWVAYTVGSTLRIVHRSGKPVRTLGQITLSHRYDWCPTEDVLAFVGKDDALKTVRASNRPAPKTLVAPARTVHMESFAWSPDGKQIVYVMTAPSGTASKTNEPGLTSAIFQVNRDGSVRKKLHDAGGNTYLPIIAGWTSDGSRVLYWRDFAYSASMMADGLPLWSQPTNREKPLELARTMLAYPDYLDPSPDGGLLALATGSDRYSWSSKRIAIVECSTGQTRFVTSTTLAALSPAWSPDGRWIAYSAGPDQSRITDISKIRLDTRKIWTYDTASGVSKQITYARDHRDEYPQWSPDGSQLLVVRIDRKNHSALWLVPSGGGKPKQFSTDLGPATEPKEGWIGYYGHVDWSQYLDWWQPGR
jgi:dipeptidyl aminopeptidase/acylaminoacyl peptidase